MGSTPKVQIFIRIGILIILIAVFGIYGFYKTKDFLMGPKIILETPKNGEVLSNSYLTIDGTAKRISQLYLNGRQIFTDEDGKFNENLLLARGYNIIEVSAIDKFNREIREVRKIVIK